MVDALGCESSNLPILSDCLTEGSILHTQYDVGDIRVLFERVLEKHGTDTGMVARRSSTQSSKDQGAQPTTYEYLTLAQSVESKPEPRGFS